MNDYSPGVALTSSDFEKVRTMLHDYCGIYMNESKQALVRGRLMKRIRKLGVRNFEQYLNYIEKDESGAEFLSLVDVLTTNKTSFFREKNHFDFIRSQVMPQMAGRSVKWWSAGCSTGEEPITCAITLLEELKSASGTDVKILATDLSRDVLQVAKNGIYSSVRLADVPDHIRRKYFDRIDTDAYQVKGTIKNMITYGRLNLQRNWPMRGPFHVIMCRNVMIYFNRSTQQQLVNKFYNILEPGGYLFLGHSESVTGNNHGFKNIYPAVYQKQ